MTPLRKTNQGFTLAEMAIVVVIASILLVTGVKVLTAQMDSASYSATQTKQDAIKQAFITYLARFQRLPCPDTRQGQGPGALSFNTAAPPDGLENRAVAGNVTSNCARYFGVLPYATLGLTREAAQDGWGNLYSYQIANGWELTANFADTNVGSATVNDRDAAGSVITLTNQVVVAVISHGKNGRGSFTSKGTRAALPVAGTNPDEFENTDNDIISFRREYTDDTGASGGSFDDVVLFMLADDLIMPLRRDGTLQNMNTTASQQLDGISQAIVGFMMGAGCNTPASIAGLGVSTTDPWGTAVDYATNYSSPPVTRQLTASDANLNPAGDSTTTALTLTSYGPDRAAGGGDDVVLTRTVGQMRGLLGTAYASRCP